jgi:spore coat protein U-like protein
MTFIGIRAKETRATATEEIMRTRLVGSIVLALAAAAAPGFGATATGTFAVSATVVKACTISASALSFGTYDPTAATADDATTDITVRCTSGTLYNVGLSAGTATGATVTSRKMSLGANLLNYGLYQDAARASNWGNTIGTDAVSGTAPGAATTINVYGRIPAGQLVPVGNFTDTITATITY